MKTTYEYFTPFRFRFVRIPPLFLGFSIHEPASCSEGVPVEAFAPLGQTEHVFIENEEQIDSRHLNLMPAAMLHCLGYYRIRIEITL